ncbi:uracil phosphoribosyltransferase [Methanobacterium petrolearium]|uniref:uracil phosphoribosyltransferase n=1 Tax=Methanobacterium petrolearium TaxID=710190 RepID=UPI001AE245D1|nr:uracil phosphoribosyltransferase [Methanobacterium petrolearium]MBP1945830.1 uracil phosphoribosyltransferase [Methanobacterium petrolearium]BDZ69620.1 uracil phosphoribosyltransferase [Methanobacterium petrolearium]
MIKIIDHLLVQEKLTLIREENIDRTNFRAGITEIGSWLAYELANTLEKDDVTVQTPLGTAAGVEIKCEKDLVVVSVLRAAIPLVEGIMWVFKEAQYGVVGAWRKDEPPFPVEVGYFKLPSVEDKIVVVADPMLATGNTMNAILDRIQKKGSPRRLVVLNVIASKQGIKCVEAEHPQVEIYTCAVDEKLNHDGYIVPGLGDAGDKAFGKPGP